MSSLNNLEIQTISKAIAVCKKVLEEIEPAIHRLDIDYNGAPDVKTSITQGDLDSADQYSGLTKTQLNDALFALTSTLKTAITDSFSALEVLAARG